MRKALVAVAVVAAALAGWWFSQNASLTRLRAEFLPWMERLERWRDGCEAARRALRSRDAGSGGP